MNNNRREAIKILFGLTSGLLAGRRVFTQDVKGRESAKLEFTQTPSSVFSPVFSIMVVDGIKKIKLTYSSDFDSFDVEWKGKTKTISMQELWDALG